MEKPFIESYLNQPSKPSRFELKLQHALSIAFLLHLLVLLIPVESTSTDTAGAEQKIPPTVSLAPLPKPSPTPIASPSPSPTTLPVKQNIPIPQPSQPSQQPAPSIPEPKPQNPQAQPSQAQPTTTEQPPAKTPTQPPTQPNPPAKQEVTPPSTPVDAFQLSNSKPCGKFSLCFQIEKRGDNRLVAVDLRAQLEKEYEIGDNLEIDNQEIIIFPITSKKNRVIEYAHIFSTGGVNSRITRMVRLPQANEAIASQMGSTVN